MKFDTIKSSTMSKKLYRQIVRRLKTVQTVYGPRVGHMYDAYDRAVVTIGSVGEVLGRVCKSV